MNKDISIRVVEVDAFKEGDDDISLIKNLGGYDQAKWFQKQMIIAESNGIEQNGNGLLLFSLLELNKQIDQYEKQKGIN